MARWYCQPSLEEGYFSIVAQTGKVIALRIPDRNIAERICFEHNDYLHALEMLDAAGIWTGADEYLSDRLSMLLIMFNNEKGERKGQVE